MVRLETLTLFLIYVPNRKLLYYIISYNFNMYLLSPSGYLAIGLAKSKIGGNPVTLGR
jgi:hypothetical protein